ncbi:hypothetical protein [Shewanella youngdeokensis]|uniref:HDOD domain-containing protein n=1 Tax=Shewanella youngdeokensis TaxID=2999068 RepID=A0ABZ0JV64_9GAMM|nr:hypothetical protein RGE70_12735 [Shewanella sp. DAU334]
MTLRRSLDQQWSKSILAHRLALTLRDNDAVKQLFGGATTLTTVTNTIAALTFTEGEPIWLPELDHHDVTPLSDLITLNCIFAASRLLFVKELEQGELGQAEHLVLAIGYKWSQTLLASNNAAAVQNMAEPSHPSAADTALCAEALQQCTLLQTIHHQLEQVRREKRKSTRNMGS